MNVVSLNICHGGGARCGAIVGYLESQNSDVIVLTEFRENKNAPRLRSELGALGYCHFAGATIKPRENSVAVFAKQPFVPVTFPALGDRDAFRLLAARFESLVVFGTYFPQQKAKSRLFNAFANGVHEPVNLPYAIVGDFNTGKHRLDEKGATFHCADQFDALAECGLVDSWRSRNPHAREYSWYSNQGNGFRIDHVLASPDADRRIRAVSYDQEPRLSRVTDHAAMLVAFDS